MTPFSISSAMRRLASELVPGGAPVYVPVRPAGGSREHECFANAAAHAAAHGGQVVYGWALWEWPTVMVEGEFHAVWRSPGGDLVDVSPREDGEARVLFLPDPSRTHDGRQVDNIRRALRDDPRIHQLIELSARIFDVMNAGGRARQTGEVFVPAVEVAPLLEARNDLIRRLHSATPSRNAPCPCGSGRKYKQCCLARQA
jgi:hypothetical protein